MGRHSLPEEKRKKATLGIAVTQADLDRYHNAAKERGMTLAQLARLAIETFLSAANSVRPKKK